TSKPSSAPRSTSARSAASDQSALLADHRDVLTRRIAGLGAHAAPVFAGARTRRVAGVEGAEADRVVDGELGAATLPDIPGVATAEHRDRAVVVQGLADLGGCGRVVARHAGGVEGAGHRDAAVAAVAQLVEQE